VLLSKEIENVSLLKHLIENRFDVKRIAQHRSRPLCDNR
jgi:hypothetical protein